MFAKQQANYYRNKSSESLFIIPNDKTDNCRARIIICNRKIPKFDMNIRPNLDYDFLNAQCKDMFLSRHIHRFSVYKMFIRR